MRPAADQVTTATDHLHLTDDQLGQIRAILQTIVEEHRRRLDENQELFRALVDDPSIDVSERQAARQAASTALEVCQRAHQAMQRIQDGTYGHCLTCQQPIPFDRLEALPMAANCVTCPER